MSHVQCDLRKVKVVELDLYKLCLVDAQCFSDEQSMIYNEWVPLVKLCFEMCDICCTLEKGKTQSYFQEGGQLGCELHPSPALTFHNRKGHCA